MSVGNSISSYVRKSAGRSHPEIGPLRHTITGEREFCRFLSWERKRADRSGSPFLLVLIDLAGLRGETRQIDPVLSDAVFSSLSARLRETDFIGWYRRDFLAGAILTELGAASGSSVIGLVRNKVIQAVEAVLPPGLRKNIVVSVHLYPEEDTDSETSNFDTVFYPELFSPTPSRKGTLFTKRVIDILGSISLLIILSPIFLFIALAIKATSKGPVLFRQERAGQWGKPFKFLKFRSMFTDADSQLHEEYIDQFIKKGNGDSKCLRRDGLFKIAHDPRVTPVGRILRKSSLDELPQLWNVLKGELSLVGPRPPIPYELRRYDPWHRRRILDVKPGITGLWQVKGRSKTSFDEMVRLDLRYAQQWTISLDLLILLQTPWAVLKGEGAC